MSSKLPLATVAPFGLIATVVTQEECPASVCKHFQREVLTIGGLDGKGLEVGRLEGELAEAWGD